MSVSLRDLHGSDAPLDAELQLKAGPFEAVFEPARAYLREVRLWGQEVVRNVYLHARGADWSTVVPTISDLEVKQGDDHFELSWKAVHKQGEINFEWKGTLTGTRDELYYRCDGKAVTAFATNRTGLCVLIPREVAGGAAEIRHPDGTISTVHLSRTIAPTEPLREMHSLAIGGAKLTFEGDKFEAEDQRNWTDSSFKAYQLRGRRAGPYTLQAGEEVMHAVRIEPNSGGGWFSWADPADHVPLIGARLCDDKTDLTDLPYDFLQVELFEDSSQAVDHARSAGKPLHVVPGKHPLPSNLRPTDIVISTEKGHGWLDGGSFDGFNQGRHEAAGFDGIQVSATPQIHTFDERSILINAPTLEDVVRSLNAIAPGAKTSVELHLSGAGPDARLQSLFGALWVLASVAALTRGGATAVTFGAVDELRTPALNALFGILQGAPKVGHTTLEHPSEVIGLTVERDGKVFVLAGNLLRAPRAVSLDTQVVSARRLTPKGWESFTYNPGQVFNAYEVMCLEVTYGTLKLS